MGNNQVPVTVPALLAVALLLFVSTTPLAHAQLLSSIIVNGSVCCTPTGNCPGGPPLPGVELLMSCSTGVGSGSGALTLLGRGITTINGTFTISLANVSSLVIDVTNLINGTLPCNVTANLPLGSEVGCSTLNTANGLLFGTTTLISILGSLLNGLVGNARVAAFFIVRA